VLIHRIHLQIFSRLHLERCCQYSRRNLSSTCFANPESPMARPEGARTSRSLHPPQDYRKLRPRNQKPWSAMFTIGLLSFIAPVLGITRFWLHNRNRIPLSIYTTCSLASFASYGYDKYRATNAGWRVRENLLHLLDAVGGWPGGFIAQYHFKHKTRKPSFQLIFWAIVLVHQWAWVQWLL
jgi:uncharacterized membrane protein YsdA (DUF1294 family)